MSEAIEHKGVVESVSGNAVHVRILQSSACGACSAAKSCMAADVREKFIDCVADEELQAGDEVMVSVSQKQGWLAVLLSFVLPFCLLMFVLWLAGKFFSETVAGTLALCSLLPYYIIVWLSRNKIKKNFEFKAKKWIEI